MRVRDSSDRVLLAKVEEAREMDRLTIEEFGLPGELLMEMAGAGTAQVIKSLFGVGTGRTTILCGGGNNGGDGYVVARHLLNSGWDVFVVSLVNPDQLKGDSLTNYRRFLACGGDVRALTTKATGRFRNRVKHADVIVDALFGLGLSRPLEGVAEELVLLANEATHGFRLAVDVPSGIDANSGRSLGACFKADHTVTYGLEKPGLHVGEGREHAGRVHRCDIAIPNSVLDAVGPQTGRFDEIAAVRRLPERSNRGHKGTYGHVGVVGGFAGKEGAAVLAALGAMHGAAGLVTWIGTDGFDSVQRPPEIMTRSWDSEGLEPRATVFVVGPGLGQTQTAKQALSRAITSGKPCVLDADALNILAHEPMELSHNPTILTPHPAEAARLLGIPTDAVIANPLQAASNLAIERQSTVLLKGAQSVVAEVDGRCTLVQEGDATLSTAGTGDVLSGLLAAYLAQGLNEADAAMLGAFVHGRAGALLGAEASQRGVSASAVAASIPNVVNQLALVWQS